MRISDWSSDVCSSDLSDFGNHPHIVGDDDHAYLLLFAQGAQQIKYLCLYRYIERRGGLVSDDDLGLTAQGQCNHDALAHAARELVRVLIQSQFGLFDAHAVQDRKSTRLNSSH